LLLLVTFLTLADLGASAVNSFTTFSPVMMHYRLLPESEVWIRQKTNLYEKVVNDKTISSSTPFVKVKLSIYYGVIRARQL